jgi:uncharacterized protein (DUF488 family)
MLASTKARDPNVVSHLYTFGYEGLDVDSFIARLRQADVRFIIDVRELPLSRKRGFSKTALFEALKAAGMAYAHVPALGCPKPIRDRYRKDGNWEAYTAAFLDHLAAQQPFIDELATLAKSSTICLLCFEADHLACHRTYVARAAQAAGSPPVSHLTRERAIPDELEHRQAA